MKYSLSSAALCWRLLPFSHVKSANAKGSLGLSSSSGGDAPVGGAAVLGGEDEVALVGVRGAAVTVSGEDDATGGAVSSDDAGLIACANATGATTSERGTRMNEEWWARLAMPRRHRNRRAM